MPVRVASNLARRIGRTLIVQLIVSLGRSLRSSADGGGLALPGASWPTEPLLADGDPPGGQGAAGSNPASPTVFGLVRGYFCSGGGLWDRLEFHENFTGPLPEPHRARWQRSGLPARWLGCRWTGERPACGRETLPRQPGHPGPMRDEGQLWWTLCSLTTGALTIVLLSRLPGAGFDPAVTP